MKRSRTDNQDQTSKKKKPPQEETIPTKNYQFKKRSAQFTGTMKKGYVSPDKRHIYLTFKQRGRNSQLLHEFQLMREIKRLGLPTVSHLEVKINQQDGNIVMQEDYIQNGVLIKPHIPRDQQRLIQLAENDPLGVRRQLETIHRILAREHLLVEDLQFIVSRENRRLLVIDPFNLIQLFPETKSWTDGKRVSNRGYAKKFSEFQDQQKTLVALIERIPFAN